jgi:hypothetical protein
MVFESQATNLIEPDTNGNGNDVFVHNVKTGTTTVVSVDSQGQQATWSSYGFSSDDGRLVVFHSMGPNMPGGTSGHWQIYLRDRSRGTTELISISSVGAPGNHHSRWPRISADGRFVGFTSQASNITHAGASPQVCLHDRFEGTTAVASINSQGNPVTNFGLFPGCGGISNDGRNVLFAHAAIEAATFYNKWYVRDRQLQQTHLVSQSTNGAPANGSSISNGAMSGDGRFIVFASEACWEPRAV